MKRLALNIAVISILIIALISGLLAWVNRGFFASNEQNKTPKISTKAAEPKTEQIRFLAMGDMLAHDSVMNNAKTPSGYDFTQYFKFIKPLLNNADVIFCNPETASAGSAYGVSGYPAFNAPTEFARDLNGVGCNLINMASNHIYDKGQAVLNATKETWEKLPILAVSGANKNADEQNDSVKYFTRNGIKVAFVAFADFSNNSAVPATSLNIYHDKTLVTRLLTTARKNADVVVVSAHWGTEDSSEVNADQKTTAQLFSSLGVDVVIGTGPHVLQKISSLTRPDGGSTLVWYSVGNMLSSQLKTDELTGGIAGFTVEKVDKSIYVKSLTFKATFMSYDWSDSDRAAGKLETRSNLALYPLEDAGDHLTQFKTTLDERRQYIKKTLGSEVSVTISP